MSKTCHDCGYHDIHPHSTSYKCRWCDEKTGMAGDTYIRVIDVDKLYNLLGEEMTKRVLTECAA